jgi:hypothetical protein
MTERSVPLEQVRAWYAEELRFPGRSIRRL